MCSLLSYFLDARLDWHKIGRKCPNSSVTNQLERKNTEEKMLKQKNQKPKVKTEQREQSSVERMELATDELGTVKNHQRSVRQRTGQVKIFLIVQITYVLKR